MLRTLRQGGPTFETGGGPDWTLPGDAVWIDLLEPTREEELAVEAALKLELPTREDMAEIELSSRLYAENGALYMTAALLVGADTERPGLAPVTFVLAGQRLVTIRYVDPKAVHVFVAQAERQPALCSGGPQILLGLLDAVIDRVADILERVSAEVDSASGAIFAAGRKGGFEPILTRLGRTQTINSRVRDSLVSLARVVSYAALAPQFDVDKDKHEHLSSLAKDIQSLSDHAGHVSGDITFLLDAALGLINIEQNVAMKVFSVMAVVFLPPTLVGAIYGMNFHNLPELSWAYGYPFSLVMMVVSALVPLWWFRRKGWL